MIKRVATLGVGVLLGAGGVLIVQLSSDPEPAPAQTAIASPPQPVGARADNPPSEPASLAQIRDIPREFERNAALYDLVRAADAHGIEALLEDAAALKMGWATGVLYRRYVELAPRAALGHLLSADGNPHMVTHLLLYWARNDLDAVLAFAATLTEPQRTQAGKSILDALPDLDDARQDEIARRFAVESHLLQMRARAEAGTNPEAAWQKALAIEPGQSRDRILRNIAYRWVGQDPAAALSALDSLADVGNRESWRSRLLQRWAETDHKAALQWAVSRPPSATRASLIAQVAAIAAKASPLEMLEFAETLVPTERRTVASSVLGVWAESDPRAALSALADMADRRLTQEAQYSLVDTWAQSDPQAAFEWARTRPASNHRTQALTIALNNVAQSDAGEALALAEDLDAVARSDVIDSVLRQWGRDDPRAAAAWLDRAPQKSHGAVAAVAIEYARLDAGEAFDWLMAQSVEAQRQSASFVVSRLADVSPDAALEQIDRIDDLDTATIAGSRVISGWAADDPRAAVRAIARMRDDSRPALYRSAFAAWSRYDAEGANAFLGQIPTSVRDAAINGMLQETLFAGNVRSAERLFNRIVDEEMRRHAATTMYLHFSRTDPDRAERYRELSSMTMDEDGSITISLPGPGF
ncbi:MAG: hypothetical protein OXK76_10150 [Gammaproteobacteria bacterium]|nr:hypothetical protein [Gammaproteobacteria bacterium]